VNLVQLAKILVGGLQAPKGISRGLYACVGWEVVVRLLMELQEKLRTTSRSRSFRNDGDVVRASSSELKRHESDALPSIYTPHDNNTSLADCSS
jgi:hypothetical protein